MAKLFICIWNYYFGCYNELLITNYCFKISDFRNRSEVFVIKPQETDEAQSVIDFLRANKTIVINIEGLDVAVAQRIIDYVGGACYAMGGSLNVVSSNIFIATPQDIEVSGDLREELVGQDALTPYVQY